jgi:hypothetical protein
MDVYRRLKRDPGLRNDPKVWDGGLNGKCDSISKQPGTARQV